MKRLEGCLIPKKDMCAPNQIAQKPSKESLNLPLLCSKVEVSIQLDGNDATL